MRCRSTINRSHSAVVDYRPSGFRRWVGPLIVLAAWFAPGLASAHGGGPGLLYDPCARRAGEDYFVHFAAYQPQFNQFEEYCGSLPRSGKTLLVFDLLGVELPQVPIAIDVVADGGAHRLTVPARRYGSGVIDLETDLTPGNYTAILMIGEPPVRLAFPISVGAWWKRLLGPASIAFLILSVAAAYCAYQIRLSSIERCRTGAGTLVELPRRHG